MPASTRIAALKFCGASVPDDSEIAHHWYLPATEADPQALRAFTLTSTTVQEALHYDGSVVMLLHEHMDDPEPMVPRLTLATNNQLAPEGV